MKHFVATLAVSATVVGFALSGSKARADVLVDSFTDRNFVAEGWGNAEWKDGDLNVLGNGSGVRSNTTSYPAASGKPAQIFPATGDPGFRFMTGSILPSVATTDAKRFHTIMLTLVRASDYNASNDSYLRVTAWRESTPPPNAVFGISMTQKPAIFALPKLKIGPWDATGTNFVGLPVETTPAAFVIPIKDTTRFKADPAYQAVSGKGAIDNWTQLRNISIGWRRAGAPAAASNLGPAPFVIDDLMLLTKYPAFSVAGSNVPVNLSFDEGPSANTGTFTLGVTALPSHDVTITVGAPDPTKLEVSSDGTNFGPAAQVIYSTANYTTPATITVRAKEGAFEGADYECDLVLSRATSDLWYGSVDKAPIANVHVAVNAAPPPPPESSILAPADTTIAGQSMSLDFVANDNGGGIAATALWVKPPGSATFVPTGLEQPGASGTFVYTAPSNSDDDDGVYYFASTTTDTLGISEPDPVIEDVALIVNTDANSPYMCTVAAGYTETTYPMTSAQDVVIRITGATNSGQITVERTPSITPPAHFNVPDQVVKESLTITSKGLGTFSATLDWQFDLALAAGVSPIDSAFAFETDGQPTVYGATRSGDTVTISGVTAFSTWYLGNPESVPVALSAFTLE